MPCKPPELGSVPATFVASTFRFAPNEEIPAVRLCGRWERAIATTDTRHVPWKQLSAWMPYPPVPSETWGEVLAMTVPSMVASEPRTKTPMSKFASTTDRVSSNCDGSATLQPPLGPHTVTPMPRPFLLSDLRGKLPRTSVPSIFTLDPLA